MNNLIGKQKVLAYAGLASGVLGLSLSALFIRWAEAPATVTAFYRMCVATVVILPFFVINRLKTKTPLRWKYLLFAVAGGAFSAMDHTFWGTSVQFGKIANITLINNIAPLWVALFSFVFLKERLNAKFWIGLLLTLAGAAVVFYNDVASNPQLSGGDALALVSSFFWAGYFLFTEQGRKRLDTLTYIWVMNLSNAATLLIVNLVLGNSFSGYPASTYLAFIGAGLVSQAFGYFALSYALGKLPASVVSPSMIAQPVLTALLAIPLAGEGLVALQWLGGFIVLTGIYLVNTKQEKFALPAFISRRLALNMTKKE